MGRGLVIGDLRVQAVRRKDRVRSFTIVWPDGSLHGEADEFLRGYEGSGSQRTYAYVLVDHLRWMQRERLRIADVSLRDLERYMGLLGAEVMAPLGEPWRVGKRPFGRDALSTAAACLKGFYLHHTTSTVNPGLRRDLNVTRLPTRADRRRAFLGHVSRSMPANPLAPRQGQRRHPKMLPDDARQHLLETVRTARDRLVVTWLADAGMRIGELCGLHMVDLHLREGAGCGECRSPHVHVCDRPGNLNEARAKTKHPWAVEDGILRGGLIKRVSPAMVHAYFDYVTTEYPRAAGHGMLLVQLHGDGHGQPWSPVAARRMLQRAGHRAGLSLIRPHQFRHSFATAVLDASGGNLVVARDAGGWASTVVVDEIYAHVDLHDPVFDAALRAVWSATQPSGGRG
jgi:integrase